MMMQIFEEALRQHKGELITEQLIQDIAEEVRQASGIEEEVGKTLAVLDHAGKILKTLGCNQDPESPTNQDREIQERIKRCGG
jgi:hypothetical protein